MFTLRLDPKSLSVGDDNVVLERMKEAKNFFEKHYL